MLLVLIIIAVLFLIGALFYKQSIQEYRINQIEWEQRHELDSILEERAPIVIRSMPQSPVWTHSDLMMRDFYGNERVPDSGKTIREVVFEGENNTLFKWPQNYRRHLYANTALSLWFENTWGPILAGTRGWLGSHIPIEGECFIGDNGLMELKANWTIIIPTEGAIVVNLAASKEKKWLPPKWNGLQPSKLTAAIAPFISKMNYIDIIVRPGTALWVPTHWLVAWTSKDEGIVPLVTTISIHTPISWIASR